MHSSSDAQRVATQQPPEATLLERHRLVERLRRTELGRAQPGLEDLAPHRPERVRRAHQHHDRARENARLDAELEDVLAALHQARWDAAGVSPPAFRPAD